MQIGLLKTPSTLMKARREDLVWQLIKSHHCTIWGHVAACWLKLVVEKGGRFWITKTTSCPSFIFSPGSCPSVFLLRSPPEAWGSGICTKCLWMSKKSHFPGTFGPGCFSGIYVWSWLWLSVKLIVCAWRLRAQFGSFIYFSLCFCGHKLTSNITYTCL